MAERVQLAGLQTLQLHGHARERGKVTESLKDGLVAIGEMSGIFKVGTAVYLCGEAYCLERSLVTLQINGVPHDEVNLEIPTELGMMFDAPCKKNAVLMAFEPQQPILETQAHPLHAEPAVTADDSQ